MSVPSPSHDRTAALQRVKVEDRVLMRKKHPCGSFHWAVTRVGADIGLRCEGCGRRLMLTRDAFYKAARRLMTSDHAKDSELWNPDAADGSENYSSPVK